MHKSRESHVCTISQPNIDGFCSNLVYFKAHGATETEIMPKHFGRKPYGRINGRYYGRKAYGRTLLYVRHLLLKIPTCLPCCRSSLRPLPSWPASSATPSLPSPASWSRPAAARRPSGSRSTPRSGCPPRQRRLK